MYLKGRNVPLRRSRRGWAWRIILLLGGILAGLIVVLQVQEGNIQQIDPFAPTPTVTRSPLSWAEEARAQFAAGKFTGAVEAYVMALTIEPKNVDYWIGRARAEIFDQQYAAGLQSAEAAVLLEPDSARTRAIKAWALRELGRTDEAGAEATQAIGLDPNYAPAHAYYSLILNDQLNFDQGFREAQIALDLDPQLIESHIAMGFSNESVGNREGAIKRYNDALALNPNVISIYRRIALNYRAQGVAAAGRGEKAASGAYFEQAIQYFNRALSLDPNNIQPYLDLSRTNIQIDRLGVAEQYLEQALALEPDNPLIHGRLGLLYFKRQNYESAEPALDLAINGGVYTVTTTLTGAVTVNVMGMPLDNLNALEFYYTMGNLKAYLYKCGPDEAPKYLGAALNFAPDDFTVQSSYSESLSICRNRQEELNAATPTPSGPTTPSP